MAEPADEATREDAAPTSVVVRRWVRRPVRAPFWLGVLVVPALLTAYVGWSQVPTLEAELGDQVQVALDEAGLADVAVAVDGRQVTALVPTGSDPEHAVATGEAVPGVLAMTPRKVYSSAQEEQACTGIQAKLDKATGDRRIPFGSSETALSGTGRTMVARSAALLVACPAVEVVVGGHADSSARDAGALSLHRARAIAAALVKGGVAQERLEPRGYGDQFEIEDGETAAARAQNHRGSLVVRAD